MAVITLLVVTAVVLVMLSAHKRPSEMTDHAIATALGRLVGDGAVRVVGGIVQATGVALDERRGPIEARTLAAVRMRGTIPMNQLYAAVRERATDGALWPRTR